PRDRSPRRHPLRRPADRPAQGVDGAPAAPPALRARGESVTAGPPGPASPPAPVRLFNTLGRRLEPIVPLEPGLLRLYTCGPTVYNHAHIGNLRTFLFEDLLKRSLRLLGYRVLH